MPDPRVPAEAEAALLTRLVTWFNAADDATRESRRRAERDRDYYDGRQWTAAEEAALAQRGQAPIVVNRIKPKVDYLLGMERRMRVGGRAHPRNPADRAAATAATDALRYVLDNNRFDEVRSEAFENLLIEGAGFAEVIAEPHGHGTRVTIHHIPWERFFVDPHARRRDLEDARYRGQVIWMDLDEALQKFPDHADLLNGALAAHPAASGGTHGDSRERWADGKRRRVRVVEIWYRDRGTVWQAVFCKGGLLSGPVQSPYVDDEGRPEDPYVACAAFISRQGERYGVVRQLIGIQDEINKRRSKALHLLSVRQVRSEKGAVEDVAAARRELTRPDGWVETVPGMAFELLPTGDMAQAQFQLLAEAKDEIDTVGATAALSGRAFDDASGRAMQVRQQGGQTELGPLFDTLRHWHQRICRKAWGRIRHFWTAARWVRVTDNPEAPSWVGLNRPVTLGDQLRAELGAIPPELEGDPRLSEIVRTENHLAALDVDIVVGELPDTVAVRQEEFRILAGLAESGVPIPPAALIEASSLRGKEEILKALNGDPASAARDAEKSETLDRLEIERRIHEIHETHARARKAEAEAKRLEAEAAAFPTSLSGQLTEEPSPAPPVDGV
ncbi:MAG: hypothetical protein OEY97_08895 [Nitrospirota bacterium]|nr:hypothetical protein [Nitrospirota bacterium]